MKTAVSNNNSRRQCLQAGVVAATAFIFNPKIGICNRYHQKYKILNFK